MSGIQTHGQIETVVTTGLVSTATYSIGPEAKPPQFILPFTDTVFLYENSSQKKSSGTFLVAKEPRNFPSAFKEKAMLFLTTNFPRSGNKFQEPSWKTTKHPDQVGIVRAAKGKATCAIFCDGYEAHLCPFGLPKATLEKFKKNRTAIKCKTCWCKRFQKNEAVDCPGSALLRHKQKEALNGVCVERCCRNRSQNTCDRTACWFQGLYVKRLCIL